MTSLVRLLLGCVFVAQAFAQWELGIVGGHTAWNRGITVTDADGRTGRAGLDKGFVAGVFAGHNEYEYLSGEARYLWERSPLRLVSGSTEYSEPAHTHVIHFDAVVHATPRRAALRPFVAFGGGVKVFTGTGTDAAAQPLRTFAILTRTQEVKPLFSSALGLKARLSNHFSLRFEGRYYLSPLPDKVIAPAPRASAGGWLHEIVPLVGFTAVW